jgi:hypothetical protein
MVLKGPSKGVWHVLQRGDRGIRAERRRMRRQIRTVGCVPSRNARQSSTPDAGGWARVTRTDYGARLRANSARRTTP